MGQPVDLASISCSVLLDCSQARARFNIVKDENRLKDTTGGSKSSIGQSRSSQTGCIDRAHLVTRDGELHHGSQRRVGTSSSTMTFFETLASAWRNPCWCVIRGVLSVKTVSQTSRNDVSRKFSEPSRIMAASEKALTLATYERNSRREIRRRPVRAASKRRSVAATDLNEVLRTNKRGLEGDKENRDATYVR